MCSLFFSFLTRCVLRRCVFPVVLFTVLCLVFPFCKACLRAKTTNFIFFLASSLVWSYNSFFQVACITRFRTFTQSTRKSFSVFEITNLGPCTKQKNYSKPIFFKALYCQFILKKWESKVASKAPDKEPVVFFYSQQTTIMGNHEKVQLFRTPTHLIILIMGKKSFCWHPTHLESMI